MLRSTRIDIQELIHWVRYKDRFELACQHKFFNSGVWNNSSILSTTVIGLSISYDISILELSQPIVCYIPDQLHLYAVCMVIFNLHLDFDLNTDYVKPIICKYFMLP